MDDVLICYIMPFYFHNTQRCLAEWVMQKNYFTWQFFRNYFIYLQFKTILKTQLSVKKMVFFINIWSLKFQSILFNSYNIISVLN